MLRGPREHERRAGQGPDAVEFIIGPGIARSWRGGTARRAPSESSSWRSTGAPPRPLHLHGATAAGLVREGEGIAAGVLESLGVNLDKVRTRSPRACRRALRGPAQETKPPARRRPSIIWHQPHGCRPLRQADPVIAARRRSSGHPDLSRRLKNPRALIGEPGSARRPSPKGWPIGSSRATSRRP